MKFFYGGKKLNFVLLILLLQIILYQVSAVSFPNEKRIALIIGNSDYLTSPLVNPVNDARAVSHILKKAGFSVVERNNIGQAAMKRAIADFGRQLATHDVGLFYYAGHGVQLKGRNYLIPVDAKIQYESDIEVEAVDLAAVLSKMEGAHNRLNLVILDACRNNPFSNNSRTLNQGLAFTSAPSGTLIAYATAPGNVAADGNDENGIYTKYLIKHIATPGMQIEDVFKQVRIDVKKETQNLQVPWESSSLEGDFYFFHDNKLDLYKPEESSTHIVAIPKPIYSDYREDTANRDTTTFNCTDLREKETFTGSMGFAELTEKEQHYLTSNCP